MWKSYLVAYPYRDDFGKLTPRHYLMMMQAYRQRAEADWNDEVDLAVVQAVAANPPKNFKIEQFYRGERNPVAQSKTKSVEQLNRELYVALQNFSDRFR